tara:strand:- start:43547 stop:45994 length:2448 start_codon:yes stop_codon:yes gene_type:complete
MFPWKLSLLLIIFSNIITGQIKSPGDFLGHELGDQFSRHHQIIDYFQHLEENSSQIQLVPYGKTIEGRLLQLVLITDQKNIQNIENIRTAHLQDSGSVIGSKNNDIAIVWLSYGVHGNESSSSEAAMKTAYALLTKHKNWLKETVVILDPCINPDGRDRFVNFYNQTKSTPYDPNRKTREHEEPWHSGRTNHYIFDLNRDWAWLTQKESQQRIKQYNRWLPHIHVDFHEQGINSPYYFAPAEEPLHEVVTEFQKNFQESIGKNHAKYFDKEGWFYFTKQTFDLLYPSYGDSYPMFLGSIGMTYEQAGGGEAGLGVNNDENILLTLKDRIKHHYTTGISTVEIAFKNKSLLIKNYKTFFADKNLKYKNFVIEGNEDKLTEISDFFDKHKIKSERLLKNTLVRGYDYQELKNTRTLFSKNALVISTNQIKGKIAHVLLEPRTKLNDSLTYDITAWSLPYAYGLKASATSEILNTIPYKAKKIEFDQIDIGLYGYALPYKSFRDSKFLAVLLKEGLGVRINTIPITNSGKNWEEGSIFILKGDNLENENFTNKLKNLAQKYNRIIHPIQTGYSDKGPDLGADELKLIKAPRVALFKNDFTSSNRYGEVWYFFEQQLEYPLMQVNENSLEKILSDIDVLIIPGGNYDSWSSIRVEKKIYEWVKNGGKIVALSEALNLFSNSDNVNLKKKKEPIKDNTGIPYSKVNRNEISTITTGSIFEASIDKTNPLGFGISRYYTLKLDAEAYYFLENEGNAFTLKSDAKPIAGFVGYLAKENQKSSLLFGQEQYGEGEIVYLVDNLLFRGFWYSGKQVFSNAIFFR